MKTHSIVELDSDDKPSHKPMTVDIDEETISKFKIGQKVKLIVEGSVGMLQVPPKGATEFNRPSVGIRVTSKKIEASNQFAELSASDDKDEDEMGNDDA